MSKTLVNEIMEILRAFEIAGELSMKKSITQVKESKPQLTTRLITFLFERSKYYILFDDNVNDNKYYVKEQIVALDGEVAGRLVKNPHDDRTTYGVPYRQKDVYLFEVISPKIRLDVELATRYPALTRSTIQKYIKAGHVQVNGEVVTQPKHDVIEQDDISMVPPEMTDFSDQELPIVYIDDNVIVLNKPAGVLTHSKGALNDEFTVADFFRRYTTHGLETNRPGIVHRLDRDTSGIIIGARNDETAAMLKLQFADRKTKKEYIAVVEGVPKVQHAVIDLPIARNPSAPSTFRVDPSGKMAQTTYEVLATNEKESLVQLWPKTGRTHQLRVHMEYINTPISGDRVYGRKQREDRLYLHAHSLEITIPISKREIFTAPLPKEFTKHFPEVKSV